MAKNESSLLAKLISLIIILAIIAGILLTWRFFAFTYDVEYTRSSVEVVWASEEDKNNLGDIYSEDYLNENFPSDYSMRFAKEENICYISTAEEKDQELNYKKFENVISVLSPTILILEVLFKISANLFCSLSISIHF